MAYKWHDKKLFLINLGHGFVFKEQLVTLFIPLRSQEHWVLVVHAHLLPHLDVLDGDDGDHLAKPWMVQPAPLCVWCEGVVCLVSKGGIVLV